jgi:microcompartment protein CcmK/EutM
MILCRVDGNLTATVKHRSADGWRLLICQPITPEGIEADEVVVAIDPLGAGLHQRVIVCTDGRHTADLVKDMRSPLCFCITGIVDQ